MKRWLSTPIFLTLAVLPSGCAARRSHDYVFNVTGIVTAEAGSPLKNAETMLEVNGPVYEAITLVKVVRRFTDDTGVFVFTYISHERGVKYTLTVSNDGFEPQTVSGIAPPGERHTIVLKRKTANSKMTKD